MLDSALAFERLVKSPKTGKPGQNGNVYVTWDNPVEVENYIKKLQTAADRLSTENRKLRKKHFIMGEKVLFAISPIHRFPYALEGFLQGKACHLNALLPELSNYIVIVS